MPVEIGKYGFNVWPQFIRDATPDSDGAMTKVQAAKLASLTPGGASPFINRTLKLTLGVKATLQPSVDVKGNVHLNTVFGLDVVGIGGAVVTLSAVGRIAAGGVSLNVVGNAIEISYQNGVATIADVEAAFGLGVAVAFGTVVVKVSGTGGTILNAATNDDFAPTPFHGGVDGDLNYAATSHVFNMGAVLPATARLLSVNFNESGVPVLGPNGAADLHVGTIANDRQVVSDGLGSEKDFPGSYGASPSFGSTKLGAVQLLATVLGGGPGIDNWDTLEGGPINVEVVCYVGLPFP